MSKDKTPKTRTRLDYVQEYLPKWEKERIESDVLGEGAHIEPQNANMNEAELDPANGVFDKEVYLSLYRSDVMDFDTSKYKSPFEYFRTTYENLTSDGSIKKKITRTGADVVVPPHSFVTFHCTSWSECRDEPFDSSILQNKPFRAKLNTGSLVPGLEQALLTMRRREKAEFLVQPHLAYGDVGCPPRIPPKAEILFDIELLDWTITPDADLIEAVDDLQLSEDSVWEKTKTNASKLHVEGNDWVKNKKHHKALKLYSAAAKLVSNCRLKNEEEEKEHNIFLLKLYTNMAVCNYELKRYNEVCTNCRDASFLKPTNAKAHYYWGQALKAIGDFDAARDHLLKADKYAPKDKAVCEALNSLEEAIRNHRKKESLFCERAFNMKKQEVTLENKDPILSSPWKEHLTTFKNSPTDKRMLLPGGLHTDELNAVRADVETLNLKMKIDPSSVCVFKGD